MLNCELYYLSCLIKELFKLLLVTIVKRKMLIKYFEVLIIKIRNIFHDLYYSLYLF